MQVTDRRTSKVTHEVDRPIVKTEDVVKGVDSRIRKAADRADILVSLPAMVATILPVLIAGTACAVTMTLCILPVLYKIVRKF